MSARATFDLVVGIVAVAIGLLSTEFIPIGLFSRLIFRRQSPMPRWLGATFYTGVGILLICFALKKP